MSKVSILYSFSDEEFRQIVASSRTHTEALHKLGYSTTSGNVSKAYHQRIKLLNVDISHILHKKAIKRTKENVFIENATCSNSVLRRMYLNENTEYYCSICHQTPEWNGKPLIMILDHINGIHNDNRLENLRWVCPNCNSQLDTTNGRMHHRIKPKRKKCAKCGANIYKGATLCKKCEKEERAFRSVAELRNKISRDKLKELIRSTSFVQIGKMFHVTDNAVRRWCRRYSLPDKSSEIKKYTDTEWLAV